MNAETLQLIEGLLGSLKNCRATLWMYAHRQDIPALTGSAFWIERGEAAIEAAHRASGKEARQRQDAERLDPKGDGPTAESGDAQ